MARVEYTHNLNGRPTVNWQIDNHEPPLSRPWGTVYPPHGCSPDWPGRVFLIVDPRGDLVVVGEAVDERGPVRLDGMRDVWKPRRHVSQ